MRKLDPWVIVLFIGCILVFGLAILKTIAILKISGISCSTDIEEETLWTARE